MTRDRLLALLKKCEQATNSGDEYSPACAVCELYTHAPDCELKAAIDWLEDESNSRQLHLTCAFILPCK